VRFGFQNKSLSLPFGAGMAVIALALAAGCDKKSRRDDVEILRVPTTPLTPPSATTTVVTRPAAPLRRSAETLSGMDDAAFAQAMLAASTRPRLRFSATREDGQTQLHAAGAEGDKAGGEMLRQLGFAVDGGTWSRWLKPNEKAAFDARILALLQERAKSAEQSYWRLNEARHPGRLLQRSTGAAGDLAAPGQLVYTGHALDVAFTDAGREPRHFLVLRDAAGRTVYARGGRLYIDDNGRVALAGQELAGRLQPVSTETDEVRIDARGAVTAYANGTPADAGRLQVVTLKNFKRDGDFYLPAEGEVEESTAAVLRSGHLEFPALDRAAEIQTLAALLSESRMLEDLQTVLAQATARPAPVVINPAAGNGPVAAPAGPVVIHADLPWTAEHLKLLGINLERTPGRLTIAADNDREALSAATVKVMQVLRLRMSLHEQNLRNAERVRDSENRLNPYRRKTVRIGEKGEPVEEVDSAPLPKTYKPGDPNADPEGFIVMPNVNKTVETTEFQAAAEEYLLMRAVAARLAPNNIFPDPPKLPAAKPEAP
jgi:flagellar basal body rod protein FlgC/flagellar basal body rod protein FlgF